MPDGFTVEDLVVLWQAGAVKLPTVAGQYSELATELNGSRSWESTAFDRSTGGPGTFVENWTSLRDTVQDAIAVKSYENLMAAGEALAQIANSYASDDHLTANEILEFNEEIEHIENSSVTDERPPDVPEPPRSEDL